MVRNLAVLALLFLMQACRATQPYSFSLADFLSVEDLPYDRGCTVPLWYSTDGGFTRWQAYRI
jgi:hypothetical protein